MSCSNQDHPWQITNTLWDSYIADPGKEGSWEHLQVYNIPPIFGLPGLIIAA